MLRELSLRKERMYATSLFQKFDCKEMVVIGGLGFEFIFIRWNDVSLFIC